ncbi:hypothetical protein TELCIR_13638 [Teladorsagia circumcincta]|uniref:E3 UFM1-protein ligase 1 homolog n=1 Tax=Teladorsagia circumcincta TaxID=45464 RepID=A0A2G9U3G5_TELCI|nr:hypothetical protein TELCIR_13638 [Teladorsagia circumcincta]
MAATWADIQRLVSDLQRVQLSQSSKKLSEANCVEVVSKLIQRSLIDVVFTRDGHSYITQKHLATEVRNECVALGGRAPLTDIATSLNVDLEHVERAAHQLASENTEFKISGGELFAEEYVTNLQNGLRTLLIENGYQTLSSLCKHWNLSQKLGLSDGGSNAKNGQVEQIITQDNADVKIETLPSMLLSTALLQQCSTAVKEAVHETDVCDVQSALQSLAIPFDDADLIAISEQVASSESGLHSAGTHIFSDRILSKTIERLGDRIDAWAHELMSRIQQERKGTQQQKKVVEVCHPLILLE